MRGAALASTVMALASLGWGCRHQFPISSGDGLVVGDGPVVGDGSTDLDGGRGADRPTHTRDGPPPDGRPLKPDLPVSPTVGPLTWSKVPSTTSTATGGCHQGLLVGGGGGCSGGALGSLGPDDAGTYAARCGVGTAEVYAACVSAATQVTTVTVPTATALCTSGTLVGGGCSCSAGGKLVASFPDPKTKSWVCDCGTSTGLTHAICAVVPTAVKLVHYQGSSCVGPEIVLAGGCACPAGAGIVKSIPLSPPWPLTWQCVCESGAPIPYVICAI